MLRDFGQKRYNLLAFVQVGRSENFTSAAEAPGLSVSAVSKSVIRLGSFAVNYLRLAPLLAQGLSLIKTSLRLRGGGTKGEL